ncbi:hypothetical protein QUB33_20965 [Microcoleus sp. B3-A4]
MTKFILASEEVRSPLPASNFRLMGIFFDVAKDSMLYFLVESIEIDTR